jgi:hypothetical protein
VSTTARIAGIAGLALHVLTAVFPYGASGLLAPAWGYVLLYAVWLALFVVGIRAYRRGQGTLVLLLPIASIVAWAVVLNFGDEALGWSA